MSVESNAALTGATREITLDGKRYSLTPLGDQDISELDLWVRKQYLSNIRNSFEDGTSQETIDREMQQAYTIAASITSMEGIGLKILTSYKGIARLAWQSIKKSHPNITCEEFTSQMFDESIKGKRASENYNEFNREFMAANANHFRQQISEHSSKKKEMRKNYRKKKYTGG